MKRRILAIIMLVMVWLNAMNFTAYAEVKKELKVGTGWFYASIEICRPEEAPNLSTPKLPLPKKKTKTDDTASFAKELQPLVQFWERDWYVRDIEDYISGKWDGKMKYGDEPLDMCSHRYIDFRTYHWKGYNSLTGEHYKDINSNIDYVGLLDVVTGREFTLAVNYETGEIEKWMFLEKKDTWNIPLGNEEINRVFVIPNPKKNETQAIVYTNDIEGGEHIYFLNPNKEVKPVV